MRIINVYVKKWSDGRIDELSISGKPPLTVQVTYDVDGFPLTLEIKGRTLSPDDVFSLLRFVNSIRSRTISQPEFAMKQSVNVDEIGNAFLAAGAGGTLITYVVPTNKTLYVTDVSMVSYVASGAFHGLVRDNVLGAILFFGGVQGCSLSLVKPKTIPPGRTMTVEGTNTSVTAGTLYATFGGYLI